MKDLRLFTGSTEIGSLRVDSISGEGNITVMETYKLDDRLKSFDPEDSNFQLKVALATEFMKLPYTLGDIIEFATDNSLVLIMQDGASKEPTQALVGGITISTASPLAGGNDSVAYDETIAATGGSGAYKFSLAGGTLPAGITVAEDGSVAGTPTETGTFTFSVTASDVSFPELSDTKEFELTIAA